MTDTPDSPNTPKTPDAPPARIFGRKNIRTPEMLAEICAQIADGKSLRSVCRRPEMPGMSTVFEWLAADETFREQYAMAMDARTEASIEDILEISDDGSNDWIKSNDPNNPGYRVNGEHIARSRLRVDTRKWIAGKMKPKKYGDRTVLAGDPEAPLIPKRSADELSDEELAVIARRGRATPAEPEDGEK